jgi:uncharacterized protein
VSGITVIKRNAAGQETWRYHGQILKRSQNVLLLEALFNLDDLPFMGTILKRGDRFVEVFYTDRWYNIFEVHDRDDDSLKGWYCNVSKPMVLEAEDCISFNDLALDLWVAPDGKQTVLDEDEFNALALDEKTKARALASLEDLKKFFAVRKAVLLVDEMP